MSDRPMHIQRGAFSELAALYAQGEEAISEGRYVDAIACFDAGIAIDDQFRQRWVTMYAQRAFARHKLGDFERAIQDYGRAIAMEPVIHQAQYYFQRGLCWMGLGGKEEEALADYQASAALYPDHPGPWHMTGKLLVDLGRFEEAVVALDGLLARGENPEGRALRGYAELNVGRATDAIADLEKAVTAAPSAWLSYLLAWAGALTGARDVLYRSMEDALRAEPGYRRYFAEHPAFAPYRGEARFRMLTSET